MALNRILPKLQPACRRIIFSNSGLTVPNVGCLNLRKTSQAVAVDLNEAPVEGERDKLYKIIELEVRCNEPAILNSYGFFVDYAAKKLDIEVGKSWTPKKAHHDRFTLLRSIHVNKKCRVQYETRTYFRFMQFHRLTGSTADTFLEYIQRNLPEGVAMKVTKVALEKIPDYIQPPDAQS